jgi:hypothetical protein
MHLGASFYTGPSVTRLLPAIHLQIDASDSGARIVLLQDGHPLAFVSKAFEPRTCGLSTYEKE